MTTIQIKTEIQKILEEVPEAALQDILDFLKEFKTQSPQQIKLAANLRKVLSEDKGLLQRLAQ